MVQTFCLGKNAFETVELYESEKFEFRYLLREISDSSFFVAELQKLLALESKTCRGRHVELQEMMTNNCNISKGAHRLLMYLVLILWPLVVLLKLTKNYNFHGYPNDLESSGFALPSIVHCQHRSCNLQGGGTPQFLETLATRSCVRIYIFMDVCISDLLVHISIGLCIVRVYIYIYTRMYVPT